MTRPKITPGPWVEELPAHGFHDPIGSNGDRVCFIHHGINNANSNARAIAAVPALLEALETLLLRSQKHLPQNADHDGLTNCDAIAKARSALIAAGYQF